MSGTDDAIAVFGIGSSRFRYALGTPAGAFLTGVEIEPTEPGRLDGQVVAAVEALRGRASRPVRAVSISCAGLIDAGNAIVAEMDTPEGTAVRDVDLGGAVDDAFGLPVHVENDCNAAALGEWAFGAAGAHRCLVHVTIGTGIGAGVVDGGRLLRGEHGQAAEVGLLPVADDARESFGVPGAWEACCSGRGIPRYVTRLLEDEPRETALREHGTLDAASVFAAADADDPVAIEYLDRIARYNAAGIGAIANAYNPGLVTLGGGVVLHNRERVRGGIEEYLDSYCFVERPEVEITPLGGDIGLYGALALPELRTEGRLRARGAAD